MSIQAPRTETTVAKPAICRRANERPLWRNDATRLNDRNGRSPDRLNLTGVSRDRNSRFGVRYLSKQTFVHRDSQLHASEP